MKKAPAKRAKPVAKKTAAKKAAKTKPRKGAKAAFVLRLYVAGASTRSQQAILRARELCATQFDCDYELEVIDIYQQPLLARDGQILATPTLVKEFPPPVRRLIGNLANCTGFFVGLDLTAKDTPTP